jgi:hypothetical protein
MTFLEQCGHFTLAEEVFDLAPIALCINECVYLVESSVEMVSLISISVEYI